MIQVGFKTDKGRVRERNEDSLFVMPREDIYIIADGVGGQNSGQIASSMAVTNIADYIKNNPLTGLETETDLKNYFLTCMITVNDLIYSTARATSENIGMATTVVLLYLVGDNGYFINIGDSRAYICREGMISQVTEDHSYVNELVKGGSITKEEAELHPRKNMITRALGGEQNILPDFYWLKTKKEDIIILCTDGLYGEVTKDEMCSMALTSCSMSELSTNLVHRANQNGGNDNITIICIKI